MSTILHDGDQLHTEEIVRSGSEAWPLLVRHLMRYGRWGLRSAGFQRNHARLLTGVSCCTACSDRGVQCGGMKTFGAFVWGGSKRSPSSVHMQGLENLHLPGNMG